MTKLDMKWNNPDPKLKPNWKKWNKVKAVEIWQGIALSLNIDPKHVELVDGEWTVAGKPARPEFQARLDIAIQHYVIKRAN